MDPEGRENGPIRAGEASPPVITSTLMRERENPCRTLDKDEDKRLKTISNQKEDKSEFGPLVVLRSDGDRRGGAGDEGGTEGGRREDEWVRYQRGRSRYTTTQILLLLLLQPGRRKLHRWVRS